MKSAQLMTKAFAGAGLTQEGKSSVPDLSKVTFSFDTSNFASSENRKPADAATSFDAKGAMDQLGTAFTVSSKQVEYPYVQLGSAYKERLKNDWEKLTNSEFAPSIKVILAAAEKLTPEERAKVQTAVKSPDFVVNEKNIDALLGSGFTENWRERTCQRFYAQEDLSRKLGDLKDYLVRTKPEHRINSLIFDARVDDVIRSISRLEAISPRESTEALFQQVSTSLNSSDDFHVEIGRILEENFPDLKNCCDWFIRKPKPSRI